MKSPKSLNLQRGLMKLGHPADCEFQKGNSSGKKKRDNEIKKKEVLQNLNKKKGNGCLIKICCQYPNHHWYIKAKTQTRSNVRSTEFRFGERHEERVGTNKI